MKKWYVVVRGYEQGIYETEADARKQCQDYFDAKYKGFEDRVTAEKYLERHIRNFEPQVYVVKFGRVPGIYTDREEAGRQVKGFDGALVRKYKASRMDLAEAFFADTSFVFNPVSKKEKKQKKNAKAKLLEVKSQELKFKNRFVCFLDTEANNNKIVSIGAVMVDMETLEIVDEFYEMCRYPSFTKMDDWCQYISKITTDEVLKSRDFLEVFNDFKVWLSNFRCVEVCTWSKNDKAYFCKTLAQYGLECPKEFKFRDIQVKISAETAEIAANNHWSLSCIKYFYGLDETVIHHALSDAQDLFNVYKAWKTTSFITERVLEKAR